MSYLPVIVNATAFVMYMTAPLAKRRVGLDYSKLTNSSLVAALGYEGMAWLGSKFISKSLSENSYYKAVCFFACFAGHYGAAKLLEWRAKGGKLEEPPKKDNTVAQNIVEKQVEGMTLEQGMELASTIATIFNEMVQHQDLVTKDPVFISSVKQCKHSANQRERSVNEDTIERIYLSIKAVLEEYKKLFSEYKVWEEKAQLKEPLALEETLMEKLTALICNMEELLDIPTLDSLYGHMSRILENIPVQIDTSSASIAECHESIMRVIDKNIYRKEEIARFQGEAKKLRRLCGPGIYVEEGHFLMMGMGGMINQMGPLRNLNSCFVDLEKTWEELSKIQEQYNSFLLGLGQVNELEQPVNITGLKEAQNEFIKRTAALASKMDEKYIGLKANLERLNKECLEAQQAQQRDGMGQDVGQPVEIAGLEEAQNEFMKQAAAFTSKVNESLKASQSDGGMGRGVVGNGHEDVD